MILLLREKVQGRVACNSQFPCFLLFCNNDRGKEVVEEDDGDDGNGDGGDGEGGEYDDSEDEDYQYKGTESEESESDGSFVGESDEELQKNKKNCRDFREDLRKAMATPADAEFEEDEFDSDELRSVDSSSEDENQKIGVEDDFSTSEEEVLEEPRRSSRIRKVLWRKACQNPANSTPDDPINLAD
ncbi:hypothetical protein ACET3Z_006043 [Daucus carota]